MIPHPQDPFFGTPPLPSWVEQFRPHQWDAIQEITCMFEEGVKVVFLDAPTGSGKTLIGEVTRRIVGKRALYVCSDKGLQDQFARDFGYARVLKGRGNYPTQTAPYPEITCSDCTRRGRDGECMWCPKPEKCEYRRAKKIALASSLAVINTAYFLAEANYVGDLHAGLVVLDEADIIERELMKFVEINIGDRVLDLIGLTAPKKGSHKTTIVTWIEDELIPGLGEWIVGNVRLEDVRIMRRVKQMSRLVAALEAVKDSLTGAENWVRDNEAGPLVLKPVRVSAVAQRLLWAHGDKWLCMSATLISAEEIAESLGLEEGEWGVVKVPMTFDRENRKIYVVPAADMTGKTMVEELPKMVEGVKAVLRRWPEDRVLVHTVSYKLATDLLAGMEPTRPFLTYRSSEEKSWALKKFVETKGAVIFAPSLGRGVDLPHDLCRVVIVAKIPFPYLGDRQVSTRANQGRNGRVWYAVQTIRSLVQMTGRGVRSESDWCVTYVLDAQFGKNLWKNWRQLFPKWWRAAVRTEMTVKGLLMNELGELLNGN